LTECFEFEYQFHVDANPAEVTSEGDCCDLRCDCGSLMARLTPAGVEIKCRRCRRITTLVLGERERARLAAQVQSRR
jgi:phage FluMu protein Com